MAHIASATFTRKGNGNGRLMDVQPDKYAILHVVSPPFLRLGTSQPGATLERRMSRERPLTRSAYLAIMGSKDDPGVKTIEGMPPYCTSEIVIAWAEGAMCDEMQKFVDLVLAAGAVAGGTFPPDRAGRLRLGLVGLRGNVPEAGC